MTKSEHYSEEVVMRGRHTLCLRIFAAVLTVACGNGAFVENPGLSLPAARAGEAPGTANPQRDQGADQTAPAAAASLGEPAALNGIQWIHLKAGKITLGPPDAPRTAELKHDITISAGPITCEQYARFLTATNRKPPVIPPGDPTLAKLADLFKWEDSRPPKGQAD
jgi:formylglycine-generating enzyme required for sulfatase activity